MTHVNKWSKARIKFTGASFDEKSVEFTNSSTSSFVCFLNCLWKRHIVMVKGLLGFWVPYKCMFYIIIPFNNGYTGSWLYFEVGYSAHWLQMVSQNQKKVGTFVKSSMAPQNIWRVCINRVSIEFCFYISCRNTEESLRERLYLSNVPSSKSTVCGNIPHIASLQSQFSKIRKLGKTQLEILQMLIYPIRCNRKWRLWIHELSSSDLHSQTPATSENGKTANNSEVMYIRMLSSDPILF
jgi:hypothetical protein